MPRGSRAISKPKTNQQGVEVENIGETSRMFPVKTVLASNTHLRSCRKSPEREEVRLKRTQAGCDCLGNAQSPEPSTEAGCRQERVRNSRRHSEDGRSLHLVGDHPGLKEKAKAPGTHRKETRWTEREVGAVGSFTVQKPCAQSPLAADAPRGGAVSPGRTGCSGDGPGKGGGTPTP